MLILIVESDPSAAAALTKALRPTACQIEAVSTGTEALTMLQRYDFDLLITEMALADCDGASLIKRLRRAHIDLPVLVLSEVVTTEAQLSAFSAGADDYVTKPYDREVLAARLQALFRRTRGFSEPRLHLGPLELNLEARMATVDGTPLSLTGKEYAILELLAVRRGTVLTKDTFLNHLYGGIDEPEMKIIDVFVCKLRRKLQKFGIDHLIETVWGRGYVIRNEDPHSATAEHEEARDVPLPTLTKKAVKVMH
ncbi:response regulator transcription factor [Oecophyllibacter saccharovorans]|uniref:response regulator transcription factor n=1 Tax=Oecophyllibacter saccharovorans TaxID=2558360 RepID=UPI0011446F93|nr:response regulator transcription factor [Oecophyllibacter saccharovorans]QDH15536.1 response regulator transcription factor [Oecophyllibacter saccharovorans]